MKRFLSIIAFVLVLFNSTFVMPSNGAMEASDYLSSYSAYISNSGNTIKVYFDVEGTAIMDSIGVTQIYLYERVDSSSSWTHVKTYLASNPTYTDILMESHTGFHYGHVEYSGNASYDYKAYVTVYAEKNGGSDSRNIIANY